MFRSYKFWCVCLALLALFAAGLATRRYILAAQRELADGNLPFTLEGAIHFHRIQQLLEQGRLPEVDHAIEFPRGIRVSATDTIADTYLAAALSRLFPAAVPLPERVRWIEGAWFCLGIPLLALWVRLLTRSWWGALAAAALYALGLAGVIRSTGQEISHENFALPLLLASLAAGAWARQAGARGRFLRRAVLSAGLLAAAQMTWDLIQFYLFVWGLWLAGRALGGRAGLPARELALAGLQLSALALAGALNPYLRSHGLLYALPLMLALGALLAGGVRHRRWGAPRYAPDPGAAAATAGRGWPARLVLLGLVLAPVVAGLLWARNYGSAYSHFGALLWAKLRYLNVKPDDPALLTFDQRILWVPALHSATWSLTKHLFPAILPASLIALLCLARRKDEDRHSNLSLLVTGCLVSLAGYWFFVRLHVFAAVFLAALLGAWAAWAGRRGTWARATVGVALLLTVLAEAGNTLQRPEEQGRLGVYYRELNELNAWLRQNVAPQPVLANFGVSAAIVTYGGCPVLLHPKFETPQIRRRVFQYGEALFKGNEAAFRDWAELEGALYYVHALGEYAGTGVSQQMRYMVDARQPRTDTAAWLFERAPRQLRLFTPVFGNAKYRVFRIRRSDDPQLAAELAEQAEQALQNGRLDPAERFAVEALARAPNNARAQFVLRHVVSLRKQDFGAAREEPK